MIAIIDYGLGNLLSIQNMLKHIEVESIITASADEIRSAEKMILPGVGKFDEGMINLNKTGLSEIIKDEVNAGKPLLGICLGMQLLGNRSEEGELEGLGLINFHTVKFNFGVVEGNYKVPHMGWERVTFISDCPLTEGLDEKQRYYFVHSYHAVCDDPGTMMIKCSYGYEFAAGVRNKNIYGTQFHPEKSHKYGMKLLDNFARNC